MPRPRLRPEGFRIHTFRPRACAGCTCAKRARHERSRARRRQHACAALHEHIQNQVFHQSRNGANLGMLLGACARCGGRKRTLEGGVLARQREGRGHALEEVPVARVRKDGCAALQVLLEQVLSS